MCWCFYTVTSLKSICSASSAIYSLAQNFQVTIPNFPAVRWRLDQRGGGAFNKGQSPGPVKFIFTCVIYLAKVQVLN